MTDTAFSEPTEPQDMLRPNAQRAKNAITLLWIVLILDVISFFSDYLQYALLSAPELSEEAAEANDTRQQIIGIVYLICYIVSAVTFIKWFRRAYYNLSLKDDYLSYSNKDVAISWFLPVINLFKPYQIMKELYRKTAYLLEDHGLAVREKLSLALVNIWWILWVISSILGHISFRLSMKTDTINDLLTNTALTMIISLVGIPLALLAIQVVRRYAQAEALLDQIPYESKQPDRDVHTEG